MVDVVNLQLKEKTMTLLALIGACLSAACLAPFSPPSLLPSIV